MLHLDFETYCDLDVRDVGAAAYARHPSCEVLMAGWAINDDPVKLWVPDGAWDYDSMPKRLARALRDDLVCAHNAEFEWNILEHVLGIHVKFNRLRDTATLALINGYPKSLAGVGAALALAEQKDKRGKLLINKFCGPRKPTKANPRTRLYPSDAPDDWEDFCNYCVLDVVVEREVWNALACK